MYNVSTDFINEISKGGKRKDVIVTNTVNGMQTTIKPYSFKIGFSGNLFKTIMQEAELDVKDGSIIEGIVTAKYGLKIEDEYEYITFNTLIPYSTEINIESKIAKTKLYDNMVKFMKEYKVTDLNLTYPCTVLQLVQAICTHTGVQLYSSSFYNSNLTIESELFSNLNCTYRDILDYVCQVTCTTAIIKDNKLYFKTPTQTNITITPNMMKKFKIKEHFGGCNSLVLGRGDLNDNIYAQDQQLIQQDGLQEIKFDNNEIIDKKREEVIEGMFNQIKGLQYYAYQVDDLGIGIFDPLDIATFEDLDENTYTTIVLNQSLTITSGCRGTSSADVPSTSTTNYKYATDSEKKQRRTEIIVNKQDGVITAVVEEIGDRSSKSTTITQDINNLESAISEIADITVSGESYSANISGLENINESEPIHIDIHPINENISYLYPNTGLFPTDTLFPKIRKIRFINTRENTYIDYELPDDLLYYDENNYDSFILDYEAQICRVVKKCKYNADGTVGLLTVPTTTDYPYPAINLTEGDYDVYLPGYGIGYIFVRLMVKNMYTTQFATRLELNSAIHQSATEIMTEVNRKVDEDEFGTKITQNYESVQIAWNNISQLIQFMLINNIPSLAFKTDSNGLLMALDKDGQHFYDGYDNEFAEMGVQTVDGQKYLAFSIPGEWESDLQNGMAWGMKINNQFYPILFIKDFYTGSQQSDVWGGKLVLNACDLVLQGVETGIETGNIKMYGNALNGLNFEDTQNNSTLLSIIPSLPNGEEYINFLDGNIEFYRNQLGTHTFRIGNTLITDDDTMFIGNSNTNNGYFDLHGNGDVYGHFNIHGNFGVSNGSTYLDNLYVSGTKNRVVEVDNKDKVLLNAYETATPYFGDIGSNKTDNKGECKIEIDKLFSQTIEKNDYKVFIQECGEGHLWVEKHSKYFIVKGTPNIDFDWEIKAIQKGYKNTRLEKIEKEEK